MFFLSLRSEKVGLASSRSGFFPTLKEKQHPFDVSFPIYLPGQVLIFIV